MFELEKGAEKNVMGYEEALAKGNAIVLVYSLLVSLCSSGAVGDMMNVTRGQMDLYLCCGSMLGLYFCYLVAKWRAGGEGVMVKLTVTSTDTSVVNAVSVANGDTSSRGNKMSSAASSDAAASESSLTKRINAATTSTGGSSTRASPALSVASIAATVPPLSTWIHSPLLIRAAPTAPTSVDGIPCTPTSQLRVNNIPIPFKTNLFTGKAMIRIANLESSPVSYFKGRNRKLQVAIQGKFTKRTRFDKVFSGQEFYGPIPRLPPKSVVDTVFALLSSKLPPTFQQDVFSDAPYFLSPLVNTCQGFACEREGEVQDVCGSESNKFAVNENTLMLGDEVPRDGQKRRKFFARAENLERFWFEPDVTYTFDYYQHYMDMNSMKFVVTSFLQFDISRIIGKQPMQLSMAKNMDGEGYFWNFEIWHKMLLGTKQE